VNQSQRLLHIKVYLGRGNSVDSWHNGVPVQMEKYVPSKLLSSLPMH
jgi:hypothetical protein